jgi:hypothetical protein
MVQTSLMGKGSVPFPLLNMPLPRIGCTEMLSASPDPTPSLFQRALTGSMLTAGSYAVTQGMRLVSNLILTRLLFPEAFGVMALVSVVLVGLIQGWLAVQPSHFLAIETGDHGDTCKRLLLARQLELVMGDFDVNFSQEFLGDSGRDAKINLSKCLL